jgi:hypothetical protein
VKAVRFLRLRLRLGVVAVVMVALTVVVDAFIMLDNNGLVVDGALTFSVNAESKLVLRLLFPLEFGFRLCWLFVRV